MQEQFAILVKLRGCAVILSEPQGVSREVCWHDAYLLMCADRAEAERTADQMCGLPDTALTVVKLVNGRLSSAEA